MKRTFPGHLVTALLVGGLILGCSSGPKPQPEQKAAPPAPAPAAAPAPAKADPPKPTVLKAVSFLPKNHILVATLTTWIEEVDKATGGLVKIEWVGGPESIPTQEQIEAVRNGVVDVNFNVTAYYEPLAPELRVFNLSELTPWEERAGGFYKWASDRHEKLGVRYVGRWLYNQPFYLWTNTPVQKPEDLKGRKLRTAALYDRFMREFGAVPVTVNTPDVYSSLQTGLVEGFGFPLLGPVDSGWTEKTKYLIDHPFFNQNGTILINLKAWNKIPADLQKLVLDATAKYERAMADHFAEMNKKELAKLEKAGVKMIRFSDADAQRYVKAAYAVEWKWLEGQVPQLVPDLKKVASK